MVCNEDKSTHTLVHCATTKMGSHSISKSFEFAKLKENTGQICIFLLSLVIIYKFFILLIDND